VAAVIWLIVGLVLVAAEVLSGELVLLALGGGALVAAAVSLFGVDPVVGILVFAVASGLLVFGARPALRRRLERGVEHPVMHHRALVGATGVVVARVDEHGGRITIGRELWSARALDAHEVIEPGGKVTVMDISGATALVVSQA
jgi:membrane protein implicated in regulation of membrane protease activity